MQKFIRGLTSLILTSAIAGVGHASQVTASTMKYSNDGAYAARFYIQYKLDDGESCWVKPKNMTAYVATGNWIKYSLDDDMMVFLGPDRCLISGDQMPENIEVWGRVYIDFGGGESCRKNKTVMYKSSGGLISYKTKGTTVNNNRCRVTKWPD